MAGAARLPVADLRRKLGDAAWFTLLALWRRRCDKTGETTVTNRGLTRVPGFAPLKDRVVRKAVARLGSAGLVVRVGWQRREVPAGRGRVERLVYVRRVRGAPGEGVLGADGFVLVPADTARWVETACGWGGLRESAAAAEPVSKGGVPGGQEGQTPRGARGAADLRERDPEGVSPPETSPLRGEVALASGGAAVLPLRGQAEAGDLLTAFAMRARGDRGRRPPPEVPPAAAGRSSGLVECSTGRLREGGVARPRPPAMLTEPLPGVPPYPGFDVLGWPVVPNPPLLDPESGPLERATRLADAYRGAVKRRLKATPWALRPGLPLATSKFYKTLVGAAEALLEHSIAPAAWAAWSVDVWLKYHGGKKPPPVAWVFSASRVAERRGWFAAEEGSYTGGRVVLGPKVKALLHRYLVMRTAIDLAQAWREPEPVVDIFFPGGSFDVALSEARREVSETKARLRAEADSGVFLW